MTDPLNPAPDPLWSELESANSEQQQKLEVAYKEVEDWNGRLLNEVAGIQKMDGTLIARLGEEVDERRPAFDLSKQDIKSVLLYLRPDTRHALHDQGELPQTVHAEGDPHIITGQIPARAKKLVDNLLASTSSELDTENSTLAQEIWHGDVAGQRVKFVKYHGIMTHHGLDLQGNETSSEDPTLNIRVYRE